MTAFSVVVTAVVLIAIAVAILLFERRRAEEITRDLTEQERARRKEAARDRRRGSGR